MTENLIDTARAVSLLHTVDVVFFDCRFDLADTGRGQSAYLQSHVPGAFYAHLDEHLSSPIVADSGRHPLPDFDALKSWLGRCGVKPSSQVVVYDDSCGTMAVRLWWLLKALGHKQVALINGGWQAWMGVGAPIDSLVPAQQDVVFAGSFDASQVVTTNDVVTNLQSGRFTLVDVRSKERFAGIQEPIDPVAGHVPGAINIPLTENLDAQGRFKSAAQLRDLYTQQLAGSTLESLVFMCGSGVTACHSMLAMVEAGFALPRLYAGSWSEWIRDPANPVAVLKPTQPA